MTRSIEKELIQHVIDMAEYWENDYVSEIHFHCFNEDYYLIGYYQCEQWLKRHNISAFDVISKCIEYEKDMFGEVYKSYDNPEETVNMLIYIEGEELLNSLDSISANYNDMVNDQLRNLIVNELKEML